jgi:hypothetical protein
MLLLLLLLLLARLPLLQGQRESSGNTTVSWPGWAGTLPSFRDQHELDMQPAWRAYLHAVYGADSHFSFPIHLSSFNLFYRKLLPAAARVRMKPPTSTLPPSLGATVGVIDRWFDPSTSARHRGTQPRHVPPLDVIWVYMYDELRSCGWAAWPRRFADPPFPFSRGFQDSAVVEVMHTCCDGPRNGYFHYYARGSGVFLDLVRLLQR